MTSVVPEHEDTEVPPPVEPPPALVNSYSFHGSIALEMQTIPRISPRVATRPQPLVPLYATFAALQAADAVTTLKALNRPGVRERNPFVRPLSGSVSGMVVLKAASTAVTVAAVEKLWRRNRVAAVTTMIGINAAYGVIVSRNAAAIED